MKSIGKSIVAEADEITEEKSSAAHRKWGLRSEARSTISNSLFLAQSEDGIPIKLEQLDSEATDFLFNAANVTLDLRNGGKYGHKKDDYITKISPVVYDPEATCPRFDAFLEEVLPDPEVRAYVQRAAGLSLTGFTGEHVLFLLHGTGRNGKGTLLDVLRYVIGNYAVQSDWSSFTESKYGSDSGANNHIARLRGARFVSASESKAEAKLAEGVIKNLTGGDAIQARFLFREFFEYMPKFKLWLATNHKPRIVGTDPAIWSRVNLIKFDVQIPVEKRDQHLPEKLHAEASGILNWMLKGYQEWQKTGLNPPAAVKAATEEYRQDSDTLNRFVEDTADIGAGFEVSAKDLYRRYVVWIDESGEYYKLTIKQFKDELCSRGFVHEHTRDGSKWFGIRLKLVRSSATGKLVSGDPPAALDSEELSF